MMFKKNRKKKEKETNMWKNKTDKNETYGDKDKRRISQRRIKDWAIMCVSMSIIINLIIESLARQGIFKGFVFMFQHPTVFFYNALIIFACLSVSILFRHRTFFMVLVGSIWIALGVVNGIILSNRMTPFTTHDIMELKDGLSIATNYLSKLQMIEIGVAVVLVVVGIVLLWKKAPKTENKPKYRIVLPIVIVIGIFMGSATVLGVKANVLDSYFPNLAYGYRDNGFCYCFVATWLDKGVGKPAEYSSDSIKNIFTKEEKETIGINAVKQQGKKRNAPNIIFLQLESFIDPTIVNDIKLNKDAIPYYRSLMKNYSSGKIQVPSVGAGTANTEFEVMTGMSVKFFGPGEYPYKTVLGDTSCESIPYNLRTLGYKTHAIHNHRGAFYNRNSVLGNLGFETFTCLEYMSSVSKTPKNWARDEILTSQIMDALKSSKGKDYIYTISVQGHGKYPTSELLKTPEIKVTSAPSEELKWSWEYYVNQLKEMDDFVKNLLETLKKFKEDTVVVMYGDHLPALDNLTENNIRKGRNTYQTDYVIWSNFNFKKKDKDLYAYQIAPYLLDRLEIHNGTLVTYQQNHQNDKNYRENLKALQYDLLYGKRFIYSGKQPFQPISIKMGVKDIKVDKVVKIGNKYYIKGRNFTEYSKINLDGEILDTVYLGPTILGVKEDVMPEDAARMKVSQVEKNKEILSTSE